MLSDKSDFVFACSIVAYPNMFRISVLFHYEQLYLKVSPNKPQAFFLKSFLEHQVEWRRYSLTGHIVLLCLLK